MDIYRTVVTVHIGAGALSLLSFWLTLIPTKGGRAHRLFGKVFLFSMIGVGLTTLPLVVGVYSQGYGPWAVFLLFLTYFVATQALNAWRAIRLRKDWESYSGRGFRAMAWGNIAFGLLILFLGIFTGKVLLTAFSFAGLFNGGFALWLARRRPEYQQWWLAEHLRGMLNAGTAAHVSFLTIGIGRLIPDLGGDSMMYIGWLGSLSVAILLRIRLEWIVASGRPLLDRPDVNIDLRESIEN